MAEAGQPRHRRDRGLGVEQQIARGFQAHPFDVLARAHAGFLAEQAAEGAWGHMRLGGQRLDGQVVAQMPWNPFQQRGEARHVAARRRQHRAELSLPAGPAQEHHQPLGDCQRQCAAEIGFHQASARSMPAVTPAELNRCDACGSVGS